MVGPIDITYARRERTDIPAAMADEIRELIARGELAPGTRLSQTQLAERFEASRVPIREALKLLSSESIVVHDPNRGFFVAGVSWDEATQLFALRNLVEGVLLPTIRWPTPAEITNLEKHAQELEKLLNAGKRNMWWQAHRSFHSKIFDLSPRKKFVSEAIRLWTLTDRYRGLLPMPVRQVEEQVNVRQHELVEALREQDLERLIQIRLKRRGQFEASIKETLQTLGLE